MIVCLPVFGAVGAITAAGAVVGAIGGGIAGALGSEKEASDQDAAFKAGVEKGRAEYKLRFDGLVERMKAIQAAGQGQREFERRVSVLFAIGFAVAAADGPISDTEVALIRDFVGGASVAWHTEELRTRVAELAASPPNFGAAMQMLDDLGDRSLDAIVDEMVELAIAIDGGESAGETAFRAAWHRHRDSRQKASA